MIMVRKGRAAWRGTGKDGNGDLTTDSGVLSSTPYSFKTRFESEPGTNPEELIAISKSVLTLRAQVPGIERDKFEELARAAEKTCPVSKVLNAEITMSFTLE